MKKRNYVLMTFMSRLNSKIIIKIYNNLLYFLNNNVDKES